ncbi:hypothetical protein [Clostridium manihotivorum]|nr:hypothetical protein [Clostridium manihotivorum]
MSYEAILRVNETGRIVFYSLVVFVVILGVITLRSKEIIMLENN